MGGAGCVSVSRGCGCVAEHDGMRSVCILLWRNNPPFTFPYAYFYSYGCAECMLAVEFDRDTGPG